MDILIKQIKQLKKTKIKKTIDKRLTSFKRLNKRSNKEWFSELCFCILTANSKAKTAIDIQKELKAKGFCSFCSKDIKKCIIKHKHRFHNNKTKYIIEAKQYLNIKDRLKNKNQTQAREWLVKNIKGLGYKEASHFLRNIGYFNLAILDRHIINLMVENKLLKQRPNTSKKKDYLKAEKIFINISKKLQMHPAELDLYMWYMKTGKVLK